MRRPLLRASRTRRRDGVRRCPPIPRRIPLGAGTAWAVASVQGGGAPEGIRQELHVTDLRISNRRSPFHGRILPFLDLLSKPKRNEEGLDPVASMHLATRFHGRILPFLDLLSRPKRPNRIPIETFATPIHAPYCPWKGASSWPIFRRGFLRIWAQVSSTPLRTRRGRTA